LTPAAARGASFASMPARVRDASTTGRRTGVVETVCVVIVLLALLALAVGLVLSSGGGVLNQG
jgi:hypothetical protein